MLPLLRRYSTKRCLSYQKQFCNSNKVDDTNVKEPASSLEKGQVIGSIGQDRKLGIIFECTVCHGKCAKTFSHLSYTKGVVIITCPTCSNRHLIADNLGWFKDKPINVETMAAEKGEKITRLTDMDQLNVFDVDSVKGIENLREAFGQQPRQPDDEKRERE